MSLSYTFLGKTITTSRSFNMAVNALKEKAQRAIRAITRKFYNFQIPLKIWLKIFVSSSPLRCTVVKYGVHSVIRAIPAGTNIQKTLHAAFCRYILHIHRNTHVEQNWADTHWKLTFKRERSTFLTTWKPRKESHMSVRLTAHNLRDSESHTHTHRHRHTHTHTHTQCS